MTYGQLVLNISQETSLSKAKVNKVIKLFSASIKDGLKKDNRFVFPTVGTFKLKPTKGKPWSINGKSGVSPDYKRPTLKFSSTFKKDVQ